MSKKNNKGYFLVETIIVLTIVSTILTTLYVNSMNYYINEKNDGKCIYRYLVIYNDYSYGSVCLNCVVM